MNMQIAAPSTSQQPIRHLAQYQFNNGLPAIIDELNRTSPLLLFKERFAVAAKELRDEQAISDQTVCEIQTLFRSTMSHFNALLYQVPRFTNEQKAIVENWLHGEFLSFSMLGSWSARSLLKPQNIAGDHHTIRQIYDGGSAERRPLGKLVNACFFNEPACQAVINREAYIRNVILEMIDDTPERALNVTSIACGPARELFTVFDQLDQQRSRLKAIGIDFDKRACAGVDDRIYARNLKNHFSTYAHNVLQLSRLSSQLEEQDLVYSMGLIDYFGDKAVVRILNNIHAILKPGGTAYIGNFHVSCDSRVFLDILLDWELKYRTEDDMLRLFENSHFAGSEVTVEYEPLGVNMLVKAIKQ